MKKLFDWCMEDRFFRIMAGMIISMLAFTAVIVYFVVVLGLKDDKPLISISVMFLVPIIIAFVRMWGLSKGYFKRRNGDYERY